MNITKKTDLLPATVRLIFLTNNVERSANEMKPLIYVCSPLRGNVLINIRKAACYSAFVFEQGGIPITPHLYLTTFLDDAVPEERAVGREMGLQILHLCDELWVFGEWISEGMAEEIRRAEELGITIKRFDEKCSSFEEQSELFKELEEIRKQESFYHSIPKVAKMMGISPSDYCDYRACRKKASDEIMERTKSTRTSIKGRGHECIKGTK